MKSDSNVLVGQITGAHGVRGLVRLHSFTDDPDSIGDYKPLTDETGKRKFEIAIKSTAKDHFVVSIGGIDSKEAADALRGVKLYVSRAALPKTGKREYYEADLIGLIAQDKTGKNFGAVLGVHNYGGGPFLEIGHNKKDSFMLPFTDVWVLEVDVKSGLVRIEPPEGWLEHTKKGKDDHD